MVAGIIKVESAFRGERGSLLVKGEELRTMSNEKVTVEIFTAGDGINYPKKGQTVTIHYTGYARNRLASQ